MNPTIEVVAQDRNRCGEAPLWDAARQRLLWSDHESGFVYELFPADGTKTVLCRDRMVFGMSLNCTGELIFSGTDGLVLWSGSEQCRAVVAEYRGERLAFNDHVVDCRGRVYAGSVHWDWVRGERERLGSLYLIEGSGAVRVVDEGIELANGLGFSPDQRTLYFADSAARRIYAYDVRPENGALLNKRLFVQVPPEEGLPDGLTVDSAGFVWSAQWYGGQVVRYDPDGKVERRMALPVGQVSSVAFGGPELTDLYITTAAEQWRSPLAPSGYSYPEEQLGGSLFRLRLDIRGKLEHLGSFPAL